MPFALPNPPSEPPAEPSAERESGAALILTIIVLTILIVLVVQFAFSVNRETIIVRNTQDDAALELASRGVVPWIRALCQEDRATGAPGGDVDTLADILFDPQAESARTLKVGEVTLTFSAEDAERRFPLPWLASGDEKKAEWAKLVLKRLIEKLEIEGDAEALSEAITSKVQALAESGKGGGVPTEPVAGQEGIQTRTLFAISQLLAAPAAAPEPGAEPKPAGEPAAAGDGVERIVLFGLPADEEKGIEGKKGLAAYVTTWDTAGINLNTALPELLFAVLPEKDKTQPEDKAKNLWESADEIVEGVRQFRIDPDFASAAGASEPAAGGAGGAGAAGAGAMGASRSWPGKAFEKVEELENAEIHAKLRAIFTPRKEDGTTSEGGEAQPTPTGEGEGETPAAAASGEAESFGLKKALVVKSRIYFVRVEAQLSPEVKNVYRFVLSRNDKDEVRALLIEEAPQ